MERNELLNVFFYFLRKGLWNKEEELSELTISAEEWKQLFELAHRQAVTGLLIDGVSRGAAKPEDEVWGRWIAHLFQLERGNRWMTQLGEEWLRSLNNVGISASVFKGSSVAGWYPNPLHRSMGDIDIVVTEGWKKLNDTLQQMGYKPERYDNDEIVVHMANAKGIYVEFHRQWEYLFHPKTNARLQELCKGGLSDEMYFVCLILHIQRHFLTYGIGLKQVCDIAVMLYTTSLNHKEIAEILKSLHAERFSRLLFGFICVYLNPFTDFPLPPITEGKSFDLLKEVILQEGYDLKKEQELVSGSKSWSLVRILNNAWFWTKRCFRMFGILQGEAIGFLVYKVSKRIKCVLPRSFTALRSVLDDKGRMRNKRKK